MTAVLENRCKRCGEVLEWYNQNELCDWCKVWRYEEQ